MSLPLRLTIPCAAALVMFGVAGAAMAEDAGVPQQGSDDRRLEQQAPSQNAPKRDPNVKPLIDAPPGCPFWGNDKLELIA